MEKNLSASSFLDTRGPRATKIFGLPIQRRSADRGEDIGKIEHMAVTRKRGRPRGQHTNGVFIRRRRESLNLTHEKLAALAGLGSTRTIARAERGERIAEDTIERLANALDVSIQELIRSPGEEITERLMRFGLAAPPPPVPWVQRSAEAKRVIARVTAPVPGCFCIAGLVGIGKTALARYVAGSLASRFPHGVVWVTAARDGRPIDLQLIQLQIAEALGFRNRLPSPEQVDRDPFDVAFAVEFWTQARLLVLDDILSSDVVARFTPRGKPVPVIVTSHLMHVAEHYGENAIVLDRVGLDDTQHILSHYLDSARLDARGVAALHHELSGIPRSIHIAAKLLQRERLVALDEYAARIHANVLDGDNPEALRTPETSLQASFSQVRDHVSPGAWSLLAALSLYEEVPFSLEWAAALGSGASRGEIERYLSQLIDVYLLIEVIPNSTRADSQLGAARRFRLESHVPLFARGVLDDRRVAVLDALARHAVDLARASGAEQSWTSIRAELVLWAHVLDTLVAAIFDPDELAAWDLSTAFSRQTTADFPALSLIEIVGALASFLEHESIPGSERWLRAAAACAITLNRKADYGRLLLALGRYWSRAKVDLETPVTWLDIATARLSEEKDFSYASAAASEAGRALFGCERPIAGLERFERSVALARQAFERGTELACRLNSAAVSFTRDPGVDGWARAAELLANAVAACDQDNFDGRFVRIICMCNLLATQHALQEFGVISPDKSSTGPEGFGDLIADWQTLEIAAPLFEARLLLLKSLREQSALANERRDRLHARARALWRDRIDEDEPIDEDLMWQLTELAFYVRLQLAHDAGLEVTLSPVIAGGFGLTDVTREIHVDDSNLVPIGLLFPVPPLVLLFDDTYVDRASRASQTILGQSNRLLDELSRVRELRARLQASVE